MACFVVSAAEAIVVTVVKKVAEKKEVSDSGHSSGNIDVPAIPLSKKLGWLSSLLWGGSGLLLFEHVWHGEVVPWFPFLTAMSNPADAAAAFHEMSTVGVGMAALVTGVWCVMCRVADSIAARKSDADTSEAGEH